jgi:UDP-glucose 4-epimerase
VTGGGGFIGSRVTARLLDAGAAVRLLGPTPQARLEGTGLLDAPGLEQQPGSLSDQPALETVLADCDSLIHLGYRVPIETGARRRLAAELGSNLQDTVCLAAAAEQAGTDFIAFASTVAVYPASAESLGEETPVGDELTPYAQAKLWQEACLRAWARRTGRRAAILRLATVYGPGETVARAIPNFIRAALNGRPAVIDGDRSSLFDPIFVDDVALAFVAATARRADGVYNIGTGVGRTTHEVAGLVRVLCGSALEAVEDPTRASRPRAICDVSRAAAELGFTATTSLEAGLADEIRWFRERGPLNEAAGQRFAGSG